MNRKPDMNDSAPSVSTSTAPLTTRRWLRVTTLATALVIALGAIAYAVNRATAAEDAPAASAPPAPKVTVAPVEEKLLTEYEELIGRVDAAETVELRARVRLPVGAPRPTLLVNERAIGTDQSQKFVLAVAKDHTAVYRTVKLGGSVDGMRVVRSGLSAGDEIIVNGLQRVRPGMIVDPEVAAVAVVPAPSSSATAVAAK